MRFQQRLREKIPISKAFFWIFFSVMAISGSAALLMYYSLYLQAKRQSDQRFYVTEVRMHPVNSWGLKSDFFAEELGLSMDKPKHLYRMNVKEAKSKLERHPLIKSAKVDKDPPSSIKITYETYLPFAAIGDYESAAADCMGHIFPESPYFPPLNLPVIFLGEEIEPLWGNTLNSHKWQTAKELVELTKSYDLPLLSVDVSRSDHPSYGRREIVLSMMEGDNSQVFLRLHPEKYQEGIKNYSTIRNVISWDSSHDRIIDLRIAHLAFIKDEK